MGKPKSKRNRQQKEDRAQLVNEATTALYRAREAGRLAEIVRRLQVDSEAQAARVARMSQRQHLGIALGSPQLQAIDKANREFLPGGHRENRSKERDDPRCAPGQFDMDSPRVSNDVYRARQVKGDTIEEARLYCALNELPSREPAGVPAAPPAFVFRTTRLDSPSRVHSKNKSQPGRRWPGRSQNPHGLGPARSISHRRRPGMRGREPRSSSPTKIGRLMAQVRKLVPRGRDHRFSGAANSRPGPDAGQNHPEGVRATSTIASSTSTDRAKQPTESWDPRTNEDLQYVNVLPGPMSPIEQRVTMVVPVHVSKYDGLAPPAGRPDGSFVQGSPLLPEKPAGTGCEPSPGTQKNALQRAAESVNGEEEPESDRARVEPLDLRTVLRNSKIQRDKALEVGNTQQQNAATESNSGSSNGECTDNGIRGVVKEHSENRAVRFSVPKNLKRSSFRLRGKAGVSRPQNFKTPPLRSTRRGFKSDAGFCRTAPAPRRRSTGRWKESRGFGSFEPSLVFDLDPTTAATTVEEPMQNTNGEAAGNASMRDEPSTLEDERERAKRSSANGNLSRQVFRLEVDASSLSSQRRGQIEGETRFATAKRSDGHRTLTEGGAKPDGVTGDVETERLDKTVDGDSLTFSGTRCQFKEGTITPEACPDSLDSVSDIDVERNANHSDHPDYGKNPDIASGYGAQDRGLIGSADGAPTGDEPGVGEMGISDLIAVSDDGAAMWHPPWWGLRSHDGFSSSLCLVSATYRLDWDNRDTTSQVSAALQRLNASDTLPSSDDLLALYRSLADIIGDFVDCATAVGHMLELPPCPSDVNNALSQFTLACGHTPIRVAGTTEHIAALAVHCERTAHAMTTGMRREIREQHIPCSWLNNGPSKSVDEDASTENTTRST